jgi:hypothetical protein
MRPCGTPSRKALRAAVRPAATSFCRAGSTHGFSSAPTFCLSYTPDARRRLLRRLRAQAAISQRVYQQGGMRLFLSERSVSREDGAGDAGFRGCEKEPRSVLASGVFNGRRVGLEVAVTNTSRPDGNATPWACYNFTDPSDRSKVLRRRLHIPMKSARIAISVVRASIMFRFNFIRLCETEGRSS